MPLSFEISRNSRTSFGRLRPFSASSVRTSNPVEEDRVLAVFLRTGYLSFSKRIWPSLTGEFTLNSSPASAQIFCSRDRSSPLHPLRDLGEKQAVDRHAGPLHPREHGSERPFDVAVETLELRPRGELGREHRRQRGGGGGALGQPPVGMRDLVGPGQGACGHPGFLVGHQPLAEALERHRLELGAGDTRGQRRTAPGTRRTRRPAPLRRLRRAGRRAASRRPSRRRRRPPPGPSSGARSPRTLLRR